MYIVIYCALCVCVLVKLRNEIDARKFKAQLISGSTYMYLDSSSTPKL